MKKKLHIENINGGARLSEGRSYGALKNLIPAGEGLVKRHGHKSVTSIKDKNGTPLRINGIFSCGYTENGETHECKIVHAGNRLFKLDAQFNYIGELVPDSGITIKDERSRGFYRDGLLYIIGAGDILVCDGENVRSAYFMDDAYIPTTSKMITDRQSGMRCETYQSPNILTPRRINKLMGTNTHKKMNLPNIFVLDSAITYKKPFVIDVKIRTKLTEDEDNDYTTSYVGINEAGEEVSTIVNLRYARTNIDDHVIFFLAEPMRNDRGEKIKIKIGEKIYDYDTVPFGVRFLTDREICFGFDVDAPYPNEENITIEYESAENDYELIRGAQMGTLCTHASGGDMLVFTNGNELYYSDPESGFSYIPRKNRIRIGSMSEKITSIAQLWDSLIGVYKESSFYRVKFVGDGYEVSSSGDSLGAFSLHSTSICGSDCLALNNQGIFGVDDYKSSVRDACLLSSRSLDIDSALSKYGRDEKREAASIAFGGKYYLFIGNECYVGVPKSKSAKEYDWYPWYGFGARVAYAFDGELFFGTNDGEIRKMHTEYKDYTEREYSYATLSLIVDNEGDKTRIITDLSGLDGDSSAKLGEHRLYLGMARKTNGGISFFEGAPTYPDGSVKIFHGDILELENGDEAVEKTVLGVLGEKVYFDGEDTSSYTENDGIFVEDEEYAVYLKKQSAVYEAEWQDGAIYLKTGGDVVKIDGFSSLLIETRRDIPSEYKTAPLPIGTHAKNATVTKLYLNVYSGTEGEITAEISTRSAKYSKKTASAPALDFDALDFNRLDTTYGLDKHISIPFFVRGFDYLDVKISANDEKPIYIGFLMLEYYVS
ncbi:MAG: hypothetical protein J6A90_00130 [Clostridia bacterium]|nr:hypothetical protein [Clostridia bacterium]